MKNCVKFNSIEELNKACGKGLTIYSIAQCGSGWFVEYETNKVERNSNSVETPKFTVDDFFSKCLSLEIISPYGYGGKYTIDDLLKFKSMGLNIDKRYASALKIMKDNFVLINERDAIDEIINAISNM